MKLKHAIALKQKQAQKLGGKLKIGRSGLRHARTVGSGVGHRRIADVGKLTTAVSGLSLGGKLAHTTKSSVHHIKPLRFKL